MSGELVYEVVKSLTGSCYPYGDHSIDEQRYENLNAKMYVVQKLVEEIGRAADLCTRPEESIQKIAGTAIGFINDLIEFLDEA